MTLQEDELQGILQVLAQIARTGEGTKDKLDPNAFQSRLSTLPRRARSRSARLFRHWRLRLRRNRQTNRLF